MTPANRETRAREVLAEVLDADGRPKSADAVRDGSDIIGLDAEQAIRAVLTLAAEHLSEGRVEVLNATERQSLDRLLLIADNCKRADSESEFISAGGLRLLAKAARAALSPATDTPPSPQPKGAPTPGVTQAESPADDARALVEVVCRLRFNANFQRGYGSDDIRMHRDDADVILAALARAERQDERA